MKKILAFISIAILVISFVGCEMEKKTTSSNSTISPTDNNIPFTELITKENKLSDFGRLNLPYDLQGSYSLRLSIEDVKTTLGLECYRTNGEYAYSVHKVLFDDNTTNYCFISYTSDAVVDTWFVSKIPSKESFNKIKKDKTTFEQIKQMDNATIIFDADKPVSYHRFLDGTMMIIQYADLNGTKVVEDYTITQDPVDIVNHLLIEDLNLIK